MKLDSYYLFIGFLDEEAMHNVEDILQAIFIGLAVATFLLNTGRSLKAIEVCKECLILLNNEHCTARRSTARRRTNFQFHFYWYLSNNVQGVLSYS